MATIAKTIESALGVLASLCEEEGAYRGSAADAVPHTIIDLNAADVCLSQAFLAAPVTRRGGPPATCGPARALSYALVELPVAWAGEEDEEAAAVDDVDADGGLDLVFEAHTLRHSSAKPRRLHMPTIRLQEADESEEGSVMASVPAHVWSIHGTSISPTHVAHIILAAAQSDSQESASQSLVGRQGDPQQDAQSGVSMPVFARLQRLVLTVSVTTTDQTFADMLLQLDCQLAYAHAVGQALLSACSPEQARQLLRMQQVRVQLANQSDALRTMVSQVEGGARSPGAPSAEAALPPLRPLELAHNAGFPVAIVLLGTDTKLALQGGTAAAGTNLLATSLLADLDASTTRNAFSAVLAGVSKDEGYISDEDAAAMNAPASVPPRVASNDWLVEYLARAARSDARRKAAQDAHLPIAAAYFLAAARLRAVMFGAASICVPTSVLTSRAAHPASAPQQRLAQLLACTSQPPASYLDDGDMSSWRVLPPPPPALAPLHELCIPAGYDSLALITDALASLPGLSAAALASLVEASTASMAHPDAAPAFPMPAVTTAQAAAAAQTGREGGDSSPLPVSTNAAQWTYAAALTLPAVAGAVLQEDAFAARYRAVFAATVHATDVDVRPNSTPPNGRATPAMLFDDDAYGAGMLYHLLRRHVGEGGAAQTGAPLSAVLHSAVFRMQDATPDMATFLQSMLSQQAELLAAGAAMTASSEAGVQEAGGEGSGSSSAFSIGAYEKLPPAGADAAAPYTTSPKSGAGLGMGGTAAGASGRALTGTTIMSPSVPGVKRPTLRRTVSDYDVGMTAPAATRLREEKSVGSTPAMGSVPEVSPTAAAAVTAAATAAAAGGKSGGKATEEGGVKANPKAFFAAFVKDASAGSAAGASSRLAAGGSKGTAATAPGGGVADAKPAATSSGSPPAS